MTKKQESGMDELIYPGDGETRKAPITRREWLQRYQWQIVKVAGLSPEQAWECATAESIKVLSDGYEDDPEGAADMEMSYWSED